MDVHPRISVSGFSTMTWSLGEDISYLQAAGVGTIGVPLRKVSQLGVNESARALDEAGLAVSSLAYGKAFSLGNPSQWDREQEALAEALDVAAALGAACMFLTTGGSRSRMTADESRDAFMAAMAQLGGVLQTSKVSVAIEQNHALNHDGGCIHSYRGLIEVCESLSCGAVVELQNCWLEIGLADSFRDSRETMCLVQVSDFVVGTEMRLSRACPGDGDIPLERLISDLLGAGYTGVFEIEVLGPRIEQEGYRSAVDRSIEWLSNCLSGLGA